MYLNRITLIGSIGSDAEKQATNATNIAIFSLAAKTSWKNDAGSWESRTEWHRCVAFGKLADFAGCVRQKCVAVLTQQLAMPCRRLDKATLHHVTERVRCSKLPSRTRNPAESSFGGEVTSSWESYTLTTGRLWVRKGWKA
jgi:hypothetical protein